MAALLPPPPTRLLHTPGGLDLEYLATGAGRPVTIFAHGLGGGIADTRPLGSGVPGTRIFLQLRGHGRSGAPPGPWSYADLAADLAAVADFHGATRAFGISLGAGALCRLLVGRPDRFERLVFFLPAVLDEPRGGPARRRVAALLDAIGSGDRSRVVDAVIEEVPAALRTTPAAAAFARQRADQLLRDGLGTGLGRLADSVAVPDAAALARVGAPALVIGCVGDELHPVDVAERLAGLLPRASLHIYDRPGVLWTDRADLRKRIGSFLAEGNGASASRAGVGSGD
jgi:pimeloyl-ACP methyl ester carboxylesterase